MKKILIAFSMMIAVLFTTNSAKAQFTTDQINTAVGNLVALQGVVVNVDDVITIGNITVTDVIDVSNVLNNNDVDVNILRTVTIDNVLNNLLRDAEFLNDNQIVIGILNGVLLVAEKKAARK